MSARRQTKHRRRGFGKDMMILPLDDKGTYSLVLSEISDGARYLALRSLALVVCVDEG